MPLEEIVVGHHVDPDFGPLQLIETRTEAAVNGGPKTPLMFRHWTGRQSELDVVINFSSGDDSPIISDHVRADFRRVTSNVNSFKRQVARSELDLAKDWAVQGGIDPPLDEGTFARLLKIESFTIGLHRLTVWIEESANIFDGHSLEVRIEMGEIKEICLAG